MREITHEISLRIPKKIDKEEISGFFQKVQSSLPKDAESLQALAYSTFERIKKQKWTRYGKLLTATACTWILADLTALLVQDFIPDPPPPRPVLQDNFGESRGGDNYEAVLARNLFNSRGIVPGENAGRSDLPAVRTSLPFNLIGTVILKDELKSLGTIEDKTATLIYPVRVGDEIPQKARITKVEARRVTFQNIANGRNEYVDLPEEILTSNPIVTIKPSAGFSRGKGGSIEQVAENRFNVPRKEIDAALGDLNTILTQARAVPNWENGQFTCYKLFQIVPNSIFDKLGLKNGDCIVGVDGDTIQDPSKAFELLTTLKDRNAMELKIKRNGKDQTNSYNIN
jgi:general secretion pathway protein C